MTTCWTPCSTSGPPTWRTWSAHDHRPDLDQVQSSPSTSTLATPSLVRLNLLLLMVVSFLPFPTRPLAEHIQEDEAEQVATTVYGLNLLLASFLVAATWRFAVRERLVRLDVPDAGLAAVTAGIAPGLPSTS